MRFTIYGRFVGVTRAVCFCRNLRALKFGGAGGFGTAWEWCGVRVEIGSLIIAALLLCGCRPSVGRVVSRDYCPQHHETVCTATTDEEGEISLDCEWELIPDKWYLTVTLDYTNFGTWECSRADYDNATNGAWFECGKGIIPEPRVEK